MKEGEQFVNQLALLTNADVAASDDLTGHVKLGGDWDLEYQTGNIESDLKLKFNGAKYLDVVTCDRNC